MFSAATRAYFDQLPELPGLDAADARRLLSAAYADVLAARDGFERAAGPRAPDAVAFLRRLAAALEAHAVFRDGVGADERRAAAFIAAESLSLTLGTEAEAEEGEHEEPAYRLLRRPVFEAIEAALLYVIGGFESNGALTLTGIESFERGANAAEAVAAEEALDTMAALVRLSPAPGPAGQLGPINEGGGDESLTAGVRRAAFKRISNAAATHLRWLRATSDQERDNAIARLRESVEILAEANAARYADVQHLSRLVLRVVEETEARALRRVPRPPGDQYSSYLQARALSRPLIWPSGTEYVAECLPGPHQHAAVALPTGSGKSFIAELAASQALLDGWVLYLVPTNALAVQVRRDLATALNALEGTTVRAFVGGSEYTELSGETVADVESGTVMVMTPEKCALALRRSPQAFNTLKLCVFDECHLISEAGGRGVLAELVAAHVLAIAPEVRFLLLSAMIENPEVAAEWLAAATGVAALAVRTPWRPTRTLRGVLGFERNGLRAAAEAAQAALAELPNHRKNLAFSAPYAALVNLQGAWTELGDDEYALLVLGETGGLKLHRTAAGGNWNYELQDDGYLNPTLAGVATLLSQRGEKVLAFVPRNRHHAFSVAASVDGGNPLDLTATADGVLIDAYVQLASLELGAPTVLGDLIRARVTVHSSALTDAERTASELAFQRGLANVMVATGTLAQGLNLPATAVLVGGTEVGYSAEPDADAETRVRAQLLNAIGRSGRPGIANHGIALVIPNHAVSFSAENLNTRLALQRAAVLAYEDASVMLTSRLGSLVALALDGAIVGEAMSTDEMVAYTYLPEGEAEDALARRILGRTFGVWRARPDAVDDAAETVAHALRAVGEGFIAAADAPTWTTEVAYRSGLALPDVFALHRAVRSRQRIDLPTDVEGWFALLIDMLRSMPLARVQALVFGGLSLSGLRFSQLADPGDPGEESWNAFAETIRRYMHGETISAIAAYATAADLPVDQGRTVGSKPIPKTLSFLQEMAYRLSLVAGGLAALWLVGDEQAQADEGAAAWALPPDARAPLDLLPLAIRCGAASRSSLAWYRFGMRHRVAAHALARSFPLPDELTDDSAIRQWIRDTRRGWLDGDIEAAEVADPGLALALRRASNFEGV